jgi:hypothetical protein
MALNLLDQVEQGLAPTKVDIVQFAESSEYCNVALYPGQTTLLKLIFLEEMTDREEDQLTYWINGGRGGSEVRISPNIRERRDFLREHGYNHCRLVELVGGRRSSKGFTTGIAMAYTMFNTLMLGDPGGAYGIDKEKDIYFSCVAGSESQAKEFQFGDFVSRVETCKAMEPYIVKSLETELRVATQDDLRKSAAAKSRGGKIQRDIARLRGKALAANAGTLRGSATMCICIDEAAHLIPGESKSSLEQIFTAAEPSLDQFGLDGMIFLNSSPYTKVGMFYEVYENCMKPFDPGGIVSFSTQAEMDTDDIAAVNSDPRSMAFQYASWNLFEGYRYYSSKYQKRTRGNMFHKMPTVSPEWDPDEVDVEERPLYTTEDQQAILQARAKEASNPEAYKVERRGKFAEVTDAYMNPSMIDRIYQGRPGDLRRQPNGDIVRDFIPFETNYGQDAINLYRYKFHLDPSSTTAGFGFAIGHVEYFPNQVTGVDEEHVVMDMIKGWDPRSMPGKVIRWEPILQEIVTLAEIFRPYEITMDQHQSAEPIQDLQERLTKKNIACRVYVVPTTNETNWKRWEVFKTAAYQGRIHAPWNEEPMPSMLGTGNITSKDELKFLQQVGTSGRFPRIDKQDIGPVQTKDRADAACIVVHDLVGNMFLTTLQQRLSAGALSGGAPGGYGIGSGGPTGGEGPPGISGYYSRRDEKMAQQGMTRSSKTRSPLGGRGGGRSRGISPRGR